MFWHIFTLFGLFLRLSDSFFNLKVKPVKPKQLNQNTYTALNMKSFTLLFCAFLVLGANTTLSATTKSEQVERFLGTHRYKKDRPLGTVKFIFKQAVLKRQGDGKKTYEQLLFNERFFSNRNNAGRLIGIEIVYKGKTIEIHPESRKIPEEAEAPPELKTRSRSKSGLVAAAEPKLDSRPAAYTSTTRKKARAVVAEEPTRDRESAEPTARQRARMVAEINSVPKRSRENDEIIPVRAAVSSVPNDPVRPRQTDRPGIHMPDSTTIAHTIDDAKKEITGWKGKMWQSILPIWEFVMWVFSSVIIMLICFAGLCRYVAKTAANESLINTYGRVIVGRWIVSAHQNAAAMLLIITWVIAIVLLIDVFMWLVFLDLPIWTLLVIWFPILWLAEKLTSWIVPNIPVIGS